MPAVRWTRAALLIVLGATSAVAFTAPGRWAAHEILDPRVALCDVRLPLCLFGVTGSESRQIEAMRAFADMQVQGEPPSVRTVPTPSALSARLAGLDGWSEAVLYEWRAGPGALHAAGVDIETCGRLIGAPLPPRFRRDFGPETGPFHSWTLVLLNEAGLRVALVSVGALRPGWALSATEPDVWVQSPQAAGDGDLPTVCRFFRTDSGEVVTG